MRKHSSITNVLLICGIVATLFFVSIDIVGGLLWHGYSFVSQAISELDAIGSPTRGLLAPLYPIYSLLMIAFGIGILSASERIILRYIGGLQVVIGAIGIAWLPFPMHLGEAVSSPANIMHSAFAGIQTFFILSSIGLGTIALRRRFAFYSASMLVIVIASGALTFSSYWLGMQSGWFGLVERITVYAYMLWVVVLSIAMWYEQRSKTNVASNSTSYAA